MEDLIRVCNRPFLSLHLAMPIGSEYSVSMLCFLLLPKIFELI